MLGAGRLRNGRCLQGSGTQGSPLLTGAKKPEIAFPTERCTISRQQRRERNGFRYTTQVHILPTTRQTTIVTCLFNKSNSLFGYCDAMLRIGGYFTSKDET